MNFNNGFIDEDITELQDLFVCGKFNEALDIGRELLIRKQLAYVSNGYGINENNDDNSYNLVINDQHEESRLSIPIIAIIIQCFFELKLTDKIFPFLNKFYSTLNDTKIFPFPIFFICLNLLTNQKKYETAKNMTESYISKIMIINEIEIMNKKNNQLTIYEYTQLMEYFTLHILLPCKKFRGIILPLIKKDLYLSSGIKKKLVHILEDQLKLLKEIENIVATDDNEKKDSNNNNKDKSRSTSSNLNNDNEISSSSSDVIQSHNNNQNINNNNNNNSKKIKSNKVQTSNSNNGVIRWTSNNVFFPLKRKILSLIHSFKLNNLLITGASCIGIIILFFILKFLWNITIAKNDKLKRSIYSFYVDVADIIDSAISFDYGSSRRRRERRQYYLQ